MKNISAISLRIITIIISCSVATACRGISGIASFKLAGTPLKVSVNTQGEISLAVESNIPIPTPLGTLEVGIAADPSEYFGVQNTLTIRLNGVDHIYDLHGYDFEIKFEPGYYKEINVTKNNNNLFLELTQSDMPVINYRTINWPGRIMFVRDHTIYEMTSNGQATPLFVAPKDSSWLRWSPDGQHIAFVGNDIDGHRGLIVMDSDGRNGRTLKTLGGLEDLVWSSDSQKILYSSNDLKVVDVESGDVVNIGRCSNSDSFPRPGVWEPENIAWNSTNDQIAFVDWQNDTIYTRPLRALEPDKCEIWLKHDSSDDFLNIRGPLVFLNDTFGLIFNNEGVLWRISAPGTAPIQAIRIGRIFDWPAYSEAMIWDPSGRYIAMTGNSNITIFDTVTGNAMVILEDYHEYTSLGWVK